MKTIIDWQPFDVGAGTYFRFIFDDFTWSYSDFAIKDFHVRYDEDGCSSEIIALSYILSEQKTYTVDEFKTLLEKASLELLKR